MNQQTGYAVRRIASSPDSLTVEFANRTTCDFASVWLRDNLDDQRDLHSGQRLVDVADLPERPLIEAARLHGDRIEIAWRDERQPTSISVHADNPYREPVPGFQALHTLETSEEGGYSLFADGFALAEQGSR